MNKQHKNKKTVTSLMTKKPFLFFVCFVTALLLTFLIKAPSFNQEQSEVLFLLLFSVGLWLTEAVPAFAVGLFIVAFLAYTQGYEIFTSNPEDIHIYTNTFSNSVIWLMLGGFFLAAAMTKTNLDKDLIHITLQVCGKNPKWILFGMMLVTMSMSALISNTAATAMVVAALMPLIAQLGEKSTVSKGLILGIPVAATTGGMGTIIGSPPNAIAVGALANSQHPIDFLRWISYGMPVSIVLTFIAWILIVRLFMTKVKAISEKTRQRSTDKASAEVRSQRYIVLIILSLTMALWLTSPIHKLSSAAVAALPLIALSLTGVIKNDDVRSIGWDTLLLVAGGLALGTGLQHCGLLNIYAGKIASLPVPPIVFYFLLAYATMLFSNIMSNTATSTVLIPLGMSVLPNNITEISLIIGLSTSTALFLPVSTPPNAIAFGTGIIEQKDLRIGGTLIGLLGPLLIVLWVLLIS